MFRCSLGCPWLPPPRSLYSRYFEPPFLDSDCCLSTVATDQLAYWSRFGLPLRHGLGLRCEGDLSGLELESMEQGNADFDLGEISVNLAGHDRSAVVSPGIAVMISYSVHRNKPIRLIPQLLWATAYCVSARLHREPDLSKAKATWLRQGFPAQGRVQIWGIVSTPFVDRRLCVPRVTP